MKLSTKSIKEKIKAHEIAKVAQEKEAAELKKLAQAKSRQQKKFLNELIEKSLGAALEGKSKVEVGVDCDLEIQEMSDFLGGRFLEIEEVNCSEYMDEQLHTLINSLDSEQIHGLKELLFSSSKKLRNLCEDIKKSQIEIYEDEIIEIIELFLEIYKEDKTLIEQITSFNVGCLELSNIVEDISEPEFTESFYEVIEALTGVFKDTWLFQNLDDDVAIFYVVWDTLDGDEVLEYEPVDDYFTALGLSWLAGSYGQLFVSSLESLVESKIKEGKRSLKMCLYRFSSGYQIELENKSKVFTLLNGIGFMRLFAKLGYQVECSEVADEDIVDIEISWA